MFGSDISQYGKIKKWRFPGSAKFRRLTDRYNINTGNFKLNNNGVEMDPAIISDRVFEPVISEIIERIMYQVDELENQNLKLDHILLVGGFIPNFYLLNSVKEQFGNQVKNIIAPASEAALAISRGATYSVLLDLEEDKEIYLPANYPDNMVCQYYRHFFFFFFF